MIGDYAEQTGSNLEQAARQFQPFPRRFQESSMRSTAKLGRLKIRLSFRSMRLVDFDPPLVDELPHRCLGSMADTAESRWQPWHRRCASSPISRWRQDQRMNMAEIRVGDALTWSIASHCQNWRS